MTVAAAVPLTAAAMAAVPASAAGGYVVAATIPVGSHPGGIAADPAAGTVYVANSGDGTVSVIDVAANTVTVTIPIPAAPQQEMSRPSGVAVDPAAGTVYVINGGGDTWGAVSVIDAATNALTATISLPTIPLAAGSDPTGVAVDPAAGTVYVPTPGNGTVSVIGEAANAVTATIPFGMALHSVGVAVDPAAGTVYLTMGGAVSLIDAATNAVTATISLPVGSGISGVAVDPAAGTVYVANDGDNTVSVLAPGQAPAITSADFASIGMRSPADVAVTATGIPASALTETGALPAGITLTDNGNGTATLSGTASAGTAGSYPVTITAANGVGSPATQAFTLHVTTAASAPAITSAPGAAATFGAVFGFTVTTDGYPLPRISKTGTLPRASISPATGTGRPSSPASPPGRPWGPTRSR
jgi:YVTN family beta-propeller protein